MPPDKETFNDSDFVPHDEADALLGDDADLGSTPSADDVAADAGKAVKKVVKQALPDDEAEEEAEEEAEDEEEEEEEEEEEDDGKPKKTAAEIQLEKKLSRVGKARENLEAQVRELRTKVEAQTEQRSEASQAKFQKLIDELDGLYETVEDFRAEGKTTEAAKAQRRIDEIRDGMTRSQAALMATKEAMSQTETRAYNTMVKELEYLDPRFDPNSDDFDQEMLDNVGELVDGYEAKGVLLTDALRKAVKMIVREDLFARGRSLKRDAPVKKAEPRKTDVNRNLATQKKTPPDMPGSRKEKASAEINMEGISEADFDKLPESTLRRYLGHEE